MYIFNSRNVVERLVIYFKLFSYPYLVLNWLNCLEMLFPNIPSGNDSKSYDVTVHQQSIWLWRPYRRRWLPKNVIRGFVDRRGSFGLPSDRFEAVESSGHCKLILGPSPLNFNIFFKIKFLNNQNKLYHQTPIV